MQYSNPTSQQQSSNPNDNLAFTARPLKPSKIRIQHLLGNIHGRIRIHTPTFRPPLPPLSYAPPEHIPISVEKDQHDARARIFRQGTVFVAIGLGVERAVEDQVRRELCQVCLRRRRSRGGGKEPLHRLEAEDGGGFVLVRGVRATWVVDAVQAVAGVDDGVD